MRARRRGPILSSYSGHVRGEFRYRFHIVSLIFWLGFSCYEVDHQNAAGGVAQLPGFTSKFSLELVLGFGALARFRTPIVGDQ